MISQNENLYQELWFSEDSNEDKKLKNTYILRA